MKVEISHRRISGELVNTVIIILAGSYGFFTNKGTWFFSHYQLLGINSKRFLLGLILLFTMAIASGQTPYHFILGAKELSGIDVYGINQDREDTYWITSNKGLISYDGYGFKTYESSQQVSSSLFNPKFDYLGVLYCNNLSGQIFKVVNDSLTLHHTVPDSLLSSFFEFDFLLNNELVVSSGAIYKLKDDKMEIIQPKTFGHGGRPFLHLQDSSLLVHSTDSTVLRITSKTISNFQISLTDQRQHSLEFIQKGSSIFGIDFNNETYLIDTANQRNINAKTLIKRDALTSRNYTTSEFVWFAMDKFGVYKTPYPTEENLPIDFTEILFENYFISYVFEDQQGNVLLGTFDNGIIVIPLTSMENIKTPSEVNVAQIVADQKGGIYYGTVRGGIYHWTDERLDIIKKEGNRIVENLEYFPRSNHLLYDENELYAFETTSRKTRRLKLDAIKQIVELEAGTYAVGNFGATNVIKIDKDTFALQHYYPTGRVQHLAYNRKTKSLYVNTSKGLFIIDTLGHFNHLLSDHQDLLISDIGIIDDKILLGTRKYGLQQLAENGIQPFLTEENGLLSNAVRRFEYYNERIFVSSENGFQVFSKKTDLIKTISPSDGLVTSRLNDFAVDEDYIWFLSPSGLQRYKLANYTDLPLPAIQNIKVYHDGNQVLGEDFHFEKNTYKVSFEIVAPSLTLSEDLRYQYRLNNEGDWIERPYYDNKIAFTLLTSGDYLFEVRLLYRNQIADTGKVSFSIAPPFWQTWWFYLMLILCVIILFYALLKYRLGQQEKKNLALYELNTSKLTALQAQMNPHFIFNALNSIQEYILHNDRRIAGKYLGKFADLIRMYLDNSRKKAITLSEELDALTLYLQLEELRFENTLTTKIEVKEGVNLEVEIPSMLVQPYVENALKHGLLHRLQDRKLTINVLESEEGDVICNIQDNGIGRKRSMEITRLRDTGHKPFATSANARRIELFNVHRDSPVLVETHDLVGDHGEALGTLVQITIPNN